MELGLRPGVVAARPEPSPAGVRGCARLWWRVMLSEKPAVVLFRAAAWLLSGAAAGLPTAAAGAVLAKIGSGGSEAHRPSKARLFSWEAAGPSAQ